MASKVEICNMALQILGSNVRIANLETERSRESLTFRLVYENTKQEILRDFVHPFTVATATLALVEEEPNDEWGYSYVYPTDCLRAVRIPSGFRNERRSQRIPFKVGHDPAVGTVILTNEGDAGLEYVKDIENTALFPPDLVVALAYRLAAYAAPSLTAGDKFKRGEFAIAMYRLSVAKAQANAYNEEQEQEPPESSSIAARNG